MDKKELQQAIKIDENNLVKDCANQSEYFLKFADQLPKLYEAKQNAKDELDEAVSKISLMIRAKPEKYIDGKITDKAISDKANIDPKVIKAKRNLVKAETKFKRAENRARAFDQRRSMIKYIVELYHDQYWTTESLSDEDELNEKFREEVNKRNRKKSNKE
jgi:phage I-like protein